MQPCQACSNCLFGPLQQKLVYSCCRVLGRKTLVRKRLSSRVSPWKTVNISHRSWPWCRRLSPWNPCDVPSVEWKVLSGHVKTDSKDWCLLFITMVVRCCMVNRAMWFVNSKEVGFAYCSCSTQQLLFLL